MGLFELFRRRRPEVHRTWTHAKDVAVFAGPSSGPELERALAREGIQARIFSGPEGRALEIVTRFLPTLLLVRGDEVDAAALLEKCGAIPGLADVPALLAGPDGPGLERALGEKSGGVTTRTDAASLTEAVLELAPELAR